MLSAPVGVIALGLVFVKLRSNEPTQSLLSKWPDKAQITKCEVRPATPLEISQGAQFGVTMRVISPQLPQPTTGLRYSVRELASKSPLPNAPLKGVWREANSEIRKAAHLLQQDYVVWEETDAFKRSSLKSADGILEVDMKAGFSGKASALSEKVFRLGTKTIPLPDVKAARKANFRIVEAKCSQLETVDFAIDSLTDESQGLLSAVNAVGNWTMEGHPDVPFEALTNVGSKYVDSGAICSVTVSIRFLTKKHPPLDGAKFRGVISVNHGWPQEVTFEYPKPSINILAPRPYAKFSAKLAPLPK